MISTKLLVFTPIVSALGGLLLGYSAGRVREGRWWFSRIDAVLVKIKEAV